MSQSNGNGNGRPSRNGRSNGKRGAPLPYDPTFIAFVVELALASGNASEAARRVGWSPDKGRRVVAEYPDLRDLVNQAVSHMAESRLADWASMHAEAVETVGTLMRSAVEERVRLDAAKYVVERNEGKIVQPIRDDTPQVSMDSVLMRFVASLHVSKGLTVAEALAYAERNPDEVRQWGRRHGLLQRGADA